MRSKCGIVFWSGLGGLAVALRLVANGWSITVGNAERLDDAGRVLPTATEGSETADLSDWLKARSPGEVPALSPE